MDINLRPDASLPPNTVKVSQQTNRALLDLLKESDLDIIVRDDLNDDSSIHMAPTLIDRISEWTLLKSLLRR